MRLESIRHFEGSIFLPVLLAAVLAAPGAPACDVPVFRYALERWRAETYQLVVFRRAPLGDREREALRLIGRDAPSPANCQALEVDLAAPLDDGLEALWAAQTKQAAQTTAPAPSISTVPSSPALPLAVLRPMSPGAAAVTIWSGPLTVDAIRSLLDSPARREIARRLAGDHSGVWLLLECGDRGADDAMATEVESRLRKLEKELKLRQPNLEAGEGREAGAGASLESKAPLKIHFSLLRLARSDPAEAVLVNFLIKMRGTQEAASLNHPAVFPIFGRGRVLCAIEGKDIEDDLGDAATFLTGPCSCELKEKNPGMDLLIAADWDRALKGGQLTAPELVGVPALLEKAASAGAAVPRPPAPGVKGTEDEEPAVCPYQSPLFKSLAAVSIAGVVLVGLATALYLLRGKRPGA